MTGHRRSRFAAMGCAVAATVSLGLSACSGSSSPSPGATTGGVPENGGTATFAWLPNSVPNYIFPFTDADHYTVFNLFEFQQLMYRPLYITGVDGKSQVDADLSLADPPKFSGDGKTVTVSLRNYKWSDGTKVTATDVAFFHNMTLAEKSLWGPYSAGAYPDNVKSLKVNSPTSFTMTLDNTYNPSWFLNNQLTLITPMPPAWDKTSDSAAAGSGGCATSVAKCKAVYQYLANKAKNIAGYDSDPLWKVVDGPWQLTSFNADGHAVFEPNPHYSGSDKPKLAKVEMLPFTSDTAEYNALQSGSGPDVGYVPPANISPGTSDPIGPLSTKYTLDPWYWWGLDFVALNFQNSTVGPIFKQLYVRQALQSIVDQKSVIKGALKGYGNQENGPVPSTPDSQQYLTNYVKSTPYPFDVDKARKLLTDHGWKVVPDGTSTCSQPGSGPTQCGAGINAGAQLVFNLEYANYGASYDQSMDLMRSNAAKAGITIKLKSAPFNTVLGDATRCNTGASTSCSWQMAEWGGRSFRPYPTGEALFASTGGANHGGYDDATTDKLIRDTLLSSSPDALQKYEDYVAKQLPLIWQPMPTEQLTVINKNLRGVTPQNPLLGISPENWYFVK